MSSLRTLLCFGLAALSLDLAGCGGTSLGSAFNPSRLSASSQAARTNGSAWTAHSVSSGKIQHVIFIIQENRSFNDLFVGYPGATTQSYGFDKNGDQIALTPEPFEIHWNIDHNIKTFQSAYDQGKMDGWNGEQACCGQPSNFAYAYVPLTETQPYWDMANQYVLSDQMFQSNIDGSFVSHQYAIAAFAANSVNNPTEAWGCPGGSNTQEQVLEAPKRKLGGWVQPCYDYQTLGDELDAASLPWRFYTSTVNGDGNLWTAYQAVNHIYNGPDWTKDVITPQAQFLNDVPKGTLAAVTWVTPTWENSDHSGSLSNTGPSWVASLVNTVGKSKFWDSSVIFVIWDDWGGWYDPIPPKRVDYDGLGFRIPMLIISPYAKKGYVSHVQYEVASIPRFIEDNFGLPQLAAADTRAADPAADALDFTQKPRPFKKIKAPKGSDFFLTQPFVLRAPDDQ